MKNQNNVPYVILALIPLLEACDIPTNYTLTTEDGSSNQSSQQGQGQHQQGEGGSNANAPKPYNVQVIPGQTYVVVDASGILVSPTSRPMQSGDHLVPIRGGQSDALEQAYVEVFETMAPISDVLRFYPYSVSDHQWQSMTEPLVEYDVLEYLPPGILSPGDVLGCAQHDHQSPGIDQFLGGSEMALKCSLYLNAGVTFTLRGPNGQVVCQNTEEMYPWGS